MVLLREYKQVFLGSLNNYSYFLTEVVQLFFMNDACLIPFK